MFALLAVIVFILGFLLELLGADTGKISLLFIGLALLAAHWAFGVVGPWGRRQP
jgi:hypothetical protein